MVLDFDGPHAEKTWAEKTGIGLSATATNRTRSGGVHRIYRIPADTPRPDRNTIERGPRRKVRLAVDPECGCKKPCGVDLLLNGYFLVPPSPGYTEDPDAPCEPGGIATISLAVLALARTTERQNGDGHPQPITPGSPISHGERNATLTSLAGSMRRRGMTEAGILAGLLEENAQRCNPPLPHQEVRSIAASVSRYPPGGDGVKDAEPTATAKEPERGAPPAEVSRDGDDFTFAWPTLGVEVRATRLRDGWEGVHGEIGVSLHGRSLH
ncbi:MAG: primase C-terminal domain-containing protein, partial [Candidatus Methylomirabilales bacterium]